MSICFITILFRNEDINEKPLKKKKTERAIAELIRERLKATNDLAAQVAAAGPDMY